MALIPELFPDIEGFQWDDGNSAKNWTRHRVTQTEAEQVFLNRPLVVMGDAAHSEAEARHFVFGRTDARRLMTIVFTVRGAFIRIISARPMSRSERSEYAKASDT